MGGRLFEFFSGGVAGDPDVVELELGLFLFCVIKEGGGGKASELFGRFSRDLEKREK